MVAAASGLHNLDFNLTKADRYFINQTISDILLVYAYYPLFLYIVGIPGNVLSIYILRSSQSLRGNFVSVFLVYLSFYNILNMLIGLSRFFLLGMFGITIEENYVVVSRLQSALATICHMVSNWTLTSLSLCKLLYIAYPYHANFWCGRNLTHVIMFLILITSCITHGIMTDGGKQIAFSETAPMDEHGDESNYLSYTRARAVIQACIFFYIPAAIILIVNFTIIFLYSRTRRNLKGGTKSLQRHLQVAYRFAVITLLCDIQIMVMEFPYAYYFTENNKWFKGGIVEETKGYLVYSVAVMMLYTNYAINFIVYCFFGNHYRQELRKMIRPCLKKVLTSETVWTSSETESSSTFSFESALAERKRLQAKGSLRNLLHGPSEEGRLSSKKSELIRPTSPMASGILFQKSNNLIMQARLEKSQSVKNYRRNSDDCQSSEYKSVKRFSETEV